MPKLCIIHFSIIAFSTPQARSIFREQDEDLTTCLFDRRSWHGSGTTKALESQWWHS
jgi:hypothetical protein